MEKLTPKFESVPKPVVSPNGGQQADGESPIETPVTETVAPSSAPAAPLDWAFFLKSSTDEEIKTRIKTEIDEIAAQSGLDVDNYCLLSLYDTKTSIDSWDADRIYRTLQVENPKHDKNVLLFLVSKGGSIEPAYQISKICKGYSKERFRVVIPRYAKSAATLLALGADEIHMGRMSELGPIDPQLSGLPALGVKRSLEIIAGICQRYPKSSETFSKYLATKLTIEQIGYSDRVCESAVQYAERLLLKKKFDPADAGRIAKDLVHEYKDHGFVIDIEEAQSLLGDSWIVTDTLEMEFGEKIYQLFNKLNTFLRMSKDERLLVVGSLRDGSMLLSLNPA